MYVQQLLLADLSLNDIVSFLRYQKESNLSITSSVLTQLTEAVV